MGSIVLLDDLTINKIAAGEVIERPASVVKELVENSIDAGATSITVEIKNGGISYIRITDNGKGFEKDDMEIAFERHATSKIRSADDLPKAKSMGFRGEALASIAAISRVELKSKTANSQIGNRIVLEGGRVLEFIEDGCPNGSTIIIENLFYNTPVRYKFLKKDFTESGYIEDAITRIALAYPNISIKLINTGKTIIQTSGNNDIKSVIYNIYGKEIAENIVDINYEYEDIKVTGVVGKPEIARSNRANQLFFVNKRFVKDKTLSAASEQAFKGSIPMGKFAFLVLNLSMDTEKVDVNVHPAKLEVRFEEEGKVFKAVYHSIKEVISKNERVIENKMQEESPLLEKKDFSNIKFDEKPSYMQNENQYRENRYLREERTHVSGETTRLNLFQKLLNRNKEQEENKKETIEQTEEDNNNLIAQIYQNRNLVNEEKNIVTEPIEEIQDVNSQEVKQIEKTQIVDLSQIQENLENKQEKQNNNEENIEIKIENEEKIYDFLYKSEEQKCEIKQENEDEIEEKAVEEQSIKVLEQTVDKQLKEQNVEKQIEDEVKEDKEQELQENARVIEKDEVENKGTAITLEEKETEYQKEDIEKQIGKQVQQELEKKEDEEPAYGSKNFEEIYKSVFGTKPIRESKVAEEPEKYVFSDENIITNENISIFENKKEFNKIKYRLVGTAFKTCYLLEIGQELYIIDQKTAKEKVIYEELKRDFDLNNMERKSSLMLLPDIIDVNKKQMEIAKENKEMYKRAGFEFDEFGENTIKLTKVPDICMELETKELFLETLNKINTVSIMDREQIEEKFIQTLAKSIAGKMIKLLSKEEIEDLLDDLLNSNTPFIDSNGEQIAIKMTRADIEKKFSRR